MTGPTLCGRRQTAAWNTPVAAELRLRLRPSGVAAMAREEVEEREVLERQDVDLKRGYHI